MTSLTNMEKAKKIFKEKSNKKFNNFFNYDKVDYINSTTKVEIICPLHGSFFQSPSCHLDSIHACQLCGKEKSRLKRTSSTERFTEKANKTHNNFYSYSKAIYTKSSQHVTIICPNHGEFEQLAGAHLKGNGCMKCRDEKHSKNHSKSTDTFIKEAIEKHDKFYNYDKTIYKISSEKIIITCPNHGDFEQTPASHLSGSGCPECGKLKQGQREDTASFIKKAKEVHGDKYDYTKTAYTQSKNKVLIICPTHGEFIQNAGSHLGGNGCKKCASEAVSKFHTKTQEQYIEEVKKLHDNKYSYERTIYKGSTEKITVTCSIHGDFKQTASSHSQGAGCKKCASMNSVGFDREKFIQKSKGRVCTFYVLRCFNENEEFYKIGITSNTIDKRYPCKTTMPYEYEVISEIKGSAGFIWDLEKEEKRKLKELKCQPMIRFNGSKTECFTNYKE